MDRKNLIPLCGLIIIICFFLPWVRACDTNISGLQLATDKDIGDPVIWVILLAGVAILGGFYFEKAKTRTITIASSVIGILVLLWKIIVPLSKGEARLLDPSIQIGGIGTILGLILALAGVLTKSNKE